MSDSNLTKKDLFNFFMLGKKIVVSGAGTVLDAVKSKVAELTDSEEAFQKRVTSQVQVLVDSGGFTEAEARQAIEDRITNRLDKAFEKRTNPAGDNVTGQ
ncbi:MAG: hypothetical protein Q8R55_01965 [Candidatus Taylorbacteria bacterium]|nr:hypothetical protein [Candidatus Taylorbacteria bacterium]